MIFSEKKNARENIKTNINPQVPQNQDESDDDNDADDKQHEKATWAFGSGKLKITVSLKFWLIIQWWENVFFLICLSSRIEYDLFGKYNHENDKYSLKIYNTK